MSGTGLRINKPPREIVPSAPTVNQQGAKGISLGGTNTTHTARNYTTS